MPLTAAHHATLAAFAKADALIAVDYLQECEATLPDVLVEYADTAPEYAAGLPHEALWEWLHRTEPFLPRRGGPGDALLRWEAVRDTAIYWVDSARGDNLRIREGKRRVLALFPEVDVLPAGRCEACLGRGYNWHETAAQDRASGFNLLPCSRCKSSGYHPAIAAPDLIPPAPLQGARASMSGAIYEFTCSDPVLPGDAVCHDVLTGQYRWANRDGDIIDGYVLSSYRSPENGIIWARVRMAHP